MDPGNSDKPEKGEDTPVSYLSAHVIRYGGVSAEGLNGFLQLFDKHFVDGTVLSSKSRQWLDDLIKSLGEIYLTSKSENKALKTERDKLAREMATLQCKLDQSTINVDDTNPDLSGNHLELPNVQQINLNALVKKPRYFNGHNPMPREWIEEYRDAMEDNLWSDQTAIFYFKHFLVEDAATWFKLSVRPKIESSWSWANLFTLFEANFLGRAERDRVKLLLKEMKMQQDDRSSTFIPRVRQYLLMLSPKMNEADQVSNITEKLRPEYATAIVDGDPSTVDDLRDICRRVEAAKDLKKAAYANLGQRADPRQDKFSKNSSNKFSKSSSNKYKQNRAPTDKTAWSSDKPRACHRCGHTNHLIRDCRATKRIDGTKLEPRTKQPSKIALVANSNTEPDKSDSEVEVSCNTIIANTNTKSQGANWLVVPLVCNGIDCAAVLDSGAQRSVICAELVKQHGWTLEINNITKLSGPNNSPLKVVGSTVIEVKIQIGSITKKKKCRWVVADSLAVPMLMGADLIIDFDLIADLRRRRIAFFAEQGFRTISEVVIPARSQKIIPVSVNAEGLVMTVQFNRGDHREVANSIGKVVDNQSSLLVLNSTAKPIRLERNLKLANVETILETKQNLQEEAIINSVVPLPESSQVIRVGDDLNSEQTNDLRNVLREFAQAFSLNGELGCARDLKHEIQLTDDAKPVVEPARRRPQIHIDETAKQVQEMLKKGIIEESSSPWASAYVIVKKKTGEYRVCVDFRRLNAVTKKDAFPLPNSETCIASLAGNTFFSSFDFASGYWQMEMDASSRELTAFRTEYGHYQFRRMPFGLCNAPASFQRLMNKTFAPLKSLNFQIYLDDICLASSNWPEHLKAIKEFLAVVVRSGIKLNASKCTLAAKQINFLGHIISKNGVQQDPTKLAAITDLPRPTNVHEVRRVIGMLNYYRRFVSNFASIATPLSNLTRKQTPFRWSGEEESAFNCLVTALQQNAVLVHFTATDPVMLKTDASLAGVGAILMQKQHDEWRIVCCHSRKLNDAERNYGVTDLEALAVVDAVQKFRPYLLGRHFELVSDHSALSVLEQKNAKSARLRRWQIVLSEFDFKFTYIKGSLHVDVDCLSRAPLNDNNDYLLDEKIFSILIPIDSANWIYESIEDKSILEKAVKDEDDLVIKDDLIYKQNKLYVPTCHRAKIMQEAHDTPRGGHGGQQVTLAKLFGFWWPSIIRDTIEYVRSCIPCQTRKVERALPVGGIEQFEAYAPLDLVAIDTLGPLPESIGGYRYVLVAVDYFTKFVEARAIKDLKAQECASFVLDLFGRFGPPKRVITDNGPQFLNDLVKDTMKVFGVHQRWSTADHSQGNAPVERMIQTLQDKMGLRHLTPRELDAWEVIIPTVVLAINTSISKTTGYSPFEMLFGRQAEIFDNIVNRRSSPKDLHTQLIKARLDGMWARAITNQDKANAYTRSHFEANHRERNYTVGDLVLMRDPNRRKGKLDPRFQGPFKVIKIKAKNVYEIQNVDTRKQYVRHTASLKPYHQRFEQEQANQVRQEASNSSFNRRPSQRSPPARTPTQQPSRRQQPPRASKRNMCIFLSVLTMASVLQISNGAFQREPNTMWLWRDVTVFGNYAEYDIATIIKSPCKSLQVETDRFNHTKMEASYESGMRSETDSLHTTMQAKCDLYDTNIFHAAIINLTRNCDMGGKEESNVDPGYLPWSKRSWVSGFFGGILGGFSGCVVMDLVSTVWEYINPNSNYNRINNVESRLDVIEAKHSSELNAFRNVTSKIVKTFNSTINQITTNKGNLHQLFTDLPEYIFGASYLLDYIIHAARLLDNNSETCHKDVNIPALAEFLQFDQLRALDPRDAKWISITSPQPNALRFRFRVTRKSPDTSFQAVEPFDVWDFKSKPFALKRYSGAKFMVFNRTANCAKAVDQPEGHMIMMRCSKKDFVDPELKKWSVIRTTIRIQDEKQVTTVKPAGSQIWIYCPFGNITIEGHSIPCPYYVFSLPAGTGFSTSDYDSPPAELFKSQQTKNVDLRLAANFVHSLATDDFDLVDSLAKLQAAENELDRSPVAIHVETPANWLFLCTAMILFHILGMGTVFVYQRYREGNNANPTNVTQNNTYIAKAAPSPGQSNTDIDIPLSMIPDTVFP